MSHGSHFFNQQTSKIEVLQNERTKAMPKLSVRPPKLGRDGKYAVVYSGGKKIRLGKTDTEEARQNYRRFVAEWAAIGDAVATRKKDYVIDELALCFLKWAKSVCGPSDYGNIEEAIELTLETYSGMSVEDFGPRALITVQERFVEKRYARRYCNKLTSFVRKMFVWGVRYEFVTPAVAGALKLVPPVHRKLAKDKPRRKAVPDEVVKMTLPHLPSMIRDMVLVQRLAAMRPSEVCKMKLCEIDRSGVVWVFRPSEHKNSWRESDDSQQDYSRIIYLGKHEQAILERRILGKEPGQYIFSPAEAQAERWELAASKRKSKVTPSQQARKEKRAKNPKQKYQEYYTATAYARAIKRTIKAVNKLNPDNMIPHWTPYMLRHAAVTELTGTDGAGSDMARAVCGQKSISVTLGYNHADAQIAEKAAMKRQNPFE